MRDGENFFPKKVFLRINKTKKLEQKSFFDERVGDIFSRKRIFLRFNGQSKLEIKMLLKEEEFKSFSRTRYPTPLHFHLIKCPHFVHTYTFKIF